MGRWTHLVCTYDGQTARLYQDGKLVATKAGIASRAPWRKPMYVGQYSGTPGPPFQVFGRVAGVKIYARALSAQEAAKAHKDTAGLRK